MKVKTLAFLMDTADHSGVLPLYTKIFRYLIDCRGRIYRAPTYKKLIFINKVSFDRSYLYVSSSDVPCQGAVGVSKSSKDTVLSDESWFEEDSIGFITN